MTLNFSWDNKKNAINKKKHKISFEEAETVFYDERARLIPDPDHSQNEERFILLGMSFNLNLLVVSHTFLEKVGIIRIISARKATKKENNKYNKGE
ncbi:MAG TPA: BrnT family toxin [Leptospiraceae bacterium]|nr:BrnT family toxin [Leptospiraceae bacterium]HRG74752.1 BrnT family toxin [Leptospiraceae bacterium]